MRIVFRVDASLYIGSGHVMRCLVLADFLKIDNSNIQFACIPQEGDMISYIESRGYEVIKLIPPLEKKVPANDSDYLAWLQRSPSSDASDFLAHVSDATWVICDHYAIDKIWQRKVKDRLECFILAIDDLVREHQADIIVDQTLGRDARDYTSAGLVLAGCNYALLGKRFESAHVLARQRVLAHQPIKALVSMGGVDLPGVTLKIIDALIVKSSAHFTVLLSSRSPHYQEVKQRSLALSNLEHIEFTDDMAQVMMEHDIAIGAPGSTSWERACLGLPSIVIPLADNQKEICQQLEERKISLKIDIDEISTRILDVFEQLIENWDSIKAKSIEICDGKGAGRVYHELVRLSNESNSNL